MRSDGQRSQRNDRTLAGVSTTGGCADMSERQESLTLTELFAPHPKELQHYGTVVPVPIALDVAVRGISTENLNQLLVDTMTLRDMYKKHHWQVSGPTFSQLQPVFDKTSNRHTKTGRHIPERG